jgi:hypothetical protein
MSATKDIRALTYFKITTQSESSQNKWKPPNDEVFNKLGDMIAMDKKEMIADFLNLFYYFIICYSKKCFKKDGIWQSSKYNFNKNTYKLSSHELIPFNYKFANENQSHYKILEIQRRMNRYRQEFKYSIDNKKIFLTDEKTREILLFIEESLEIICTDIQEPVILISYDIKAKISKYTEYLQKRKKSKKSTKLNYAALEALGIDVNQS